MNFETSAVATIADGDSFVGLHDMVEWRFDLSSDITLAGQRRRASARIELIVNGDKVATSAIHTPEDLEWEARADLLRAVVIEMAPSAALPGDLQAVFLYATLREGRILSRNVALFKENSLSWCRGLLNAAAIPGTEFAGCDISCNLAKLGKQIETIKRFSIPPAFYVDEIRACLGKHIEQLSEVGFFSAVMRSDLNLQQYIDVLGQMHAYVRYTTRILGYCVTYSDDSNMRAHFATHLAEEVNHEKIIEADLKHLNADVDYVMFDLQPDTGTYQFLGIELAIVSHFHDPVLLMAAPLAAEGITAHLSKNFIGRLNSLIAGWGFSHPERASMFLSSHIQFDSGEDGHLEGNFDLLKAHIRNEREARRFISALKSCCEGIAHSFRRSCEEKSLWSSLGRSPNATLS